MPPGAGTGLPAGVDKLKMAADQAASNSKASVLAAQRGSEIGLVSRPAAGVLAPLQKLECCPVLLATDLDDFGVSPVKRHGMGCLLLDGDEEKGQLRAGHGFHSIDVERRLNVVAEVGDGARKAAAAGIDSHRLQPTIGNEGCFLSFIVEVL